MLKFLCFNIRLGVEVRLWSLIREERLLNVNSHVNNLTSNSRNNSLTIENSTHIQQRQQTDNLLNNNNNNWIRNNADPTDNNNSLIPIIRYCSRQIGNPKRHNNYKHCDSEYDTCSD